MSSSRGTPMTTSASPPLIVSRKYPRRRARQWYSSLRSRSRATSWASLFSKPSSRELEKGRLLGSATTARRPGLVVCAEAVDAKAQATNDATSNTSELREAEHIERASFGSRGGEV